MYSRCKSTMENPHFGVSRYNHLEKLGFRGTEPVPFDLSVARGMCVLRKWERTGSAGTALRVSGRPPAAPSTVPRFRVD